MFLVVVSPWVSDVPSWSEALLGTWLLALAFVLLATNSPVGLGPLTCQRGLFSARIAASAILRLCCWLLIRQATVRKPASLPTPRCGAACVLWR